MLNRTVCDVLEELRKAYETRNFSYIPGLIEEIQSMVNRMEAKLWDQKDHERLKRDHAELKKKVRKLKAKTEKLEE
jgi:hypothetical protein